MCARNISPIHRSVSVTTGGDECLGGLFCCKAGAREQLRELGVALVHSFDSDVWKYHKSSFKKILLQVESAAM